ncbi:uncharacterized protein [Gossypium hirsutum]|uniref:Uncharacterized protein isoform X3 n=2 Tax=Gossypium hirsutum TaxID=3635 RepID=A0ABM3AWS3_GOSHI|nr:uncharacterized protein LOC107915146 isoform X3 [Gossypium hirsutum]
MDFPLNLTLLSLLFLRLPHQPQFMLFLQFYLMPNPVNNLWPSSSEGSRGRRRGRSSSRIQCQLCGKIGHTVDRCYHRFDPSFKGNAFRPFPSPPFVVSMPTSLPVQAMYSMCAPPSLLGGYASSWATPGPYHTTALMYTGLIGSTMTPSPNTHLNTRLPPQTDASTGSVSQTPQAHIATPALLDDNAWYPDSGATHHLTSFETSLTSSVPYLSSDK